MNVDFYVITYVWSKEIERTVEKNERCLYPVKMAGKTGVLESN